MRKPFFQIILIIIVLLALPDTTYGFQQRHLRDSLQNERDSLIEVLRIKDSILLQRSLDSIFMSNLIEVKELEYDSLQFQLRTMILANKIDSVRQYTSDSINREFNRYSRWELRDSLYNIDEDSVRNNLDRLLDILFHDKARSPDSESLRETVSSLFKHLANDSIFLYLINGHNDSIPFVMKKNSSDSTAMFLVNSRQDSVKIYLYGNNKSSIYLMADDDFRLSTMLKKEIPRDILREDWTHISRIKIPQRNIQAVQPRNWKRGGDIDFSLTQMAYSHWAPGGSNRVSFLITSKGYANFNKGKVSWNNDYYYRYGLLKLEGLRLYKNYELLRIKNSFQHKAFNNYHYSLSSQFESQFFPGYNNAKDTIPLSKFMGPAKYNLGLGMTYKPSKDLEITGDPISGQFTFVLDTLTINPRKHGVPVGQKVKKEIGVRVNVKYHNVLWEKIELTTTLGLFRSYVNNPMPDIDWMTDLKLKVNKYLSTKLYLYLKYDDDVLIPDYEYIDGVRTKVGEGKFLQVQQNFGITFTFYL